MRPERHVGNVVGVGDPERTGALRVEVKTLSEGAALGNGWVPGIYPFAGRGEGFYFLPPLGSLLEVEVEADPGRATEDLDARWVGCRYTREDALPEEVRSDPVNRGALKFGAEVLLLDKLLRRIALISPNVRLGEEDASHPLTRGDTHNAQLDVYLQAEQAYDDLLTAVMTAVGVAIGPPAGWSTLSPGAPATTDMLLAFAGTVGTPLGLLLSGTAAWVAAKATFRAAESTWLSTRCKTE